MIALTRILAVVSLLWLPLGWAEAADNYKHGADSKRQRGVPQGKVSEHVWKSTLYGGTLHKYYVYVPAQYQRTKPAALMVFQDGHAYVDAKGDFRAPIVFDNLIHQKAMPVTIGLFVNPGHPGSLPTNAWRASNRTHEYDQMNDRYVRFLLTELIPEIRKKYNLTSDPKLRAIAGSSSGGICAFTAAWHRPDQFGLVMSHIGSFTNIGGGHLYPSMIRATTAKPLRVFLQDGSSDVDNMYGNWFLANQQMAAALKFKGNPVKFVAGTGGHNGKHGGAIFPDSLRWLWREAAR